VLVAIIRHNYEIDDLEILDLLEKKQFKASLLPTINKR
jgi:hypothetical protein